MSSLDLMLTSINISSILKRISSVRNIIRSIISSYSTICDSLHIPILIRKKINFMYSHLQVLLQILSITDSRRIKKKLMKVLLMKAISMLLNRGSLRFLKSLHHSSKTRESISLRIIQ